MNAPTQRRWRSLFIRLLAVVLSTVVTIALLEAVLRATRDQGRFYPYHKNDVTAVYPSESVTRGVSGVAYFTTNSFGCRGPELAGQKHRLLTIGGSTTACAVLDDGETWPQLVMDLVNKHFNQADFLWVTNSGIDGLNTRHHIAHSKYLVHKIPNLDHVLIYCGINDLTDWLIQDNDYDPHFAITQENLDKQIPKSFRFSNFNSPADTWYQHLELWKRASSLKAAILSRRRAATRAQGGIVEDDRLEWLKKERAHLGRVKLSTVEPAKLATFDNALDAYAQNLGAIIQLVREAHSEPIFMAQAMQFDELNEQQKKDRWIGAMSKGTAYVEMAQLQDLLRKYNDRMQAVANEHHVLFIPLPKLLEGKPDPYYDSIHFNEAGAREVAQIVSDFLIKNVYDATAPKTARR